MTPVLTLFWMTRGGRQLVCAFAEKEQKKEMGEPHGRFFGVVFSIAIFHVPTLVVSNQAHWN